MVRTLTRRVKGASDMKALRMWTITVLLGLSAILAGCGVSSSQALAKNNTDVGTHVQGKSPITKQAGTTTHGVKSLNETTINDLGPSPSVTAAEVVSQWKQANVAGGSPGAHMTPTVSASVHHAVNGAQLNTVTFVNATDGWVGGQGVLWHTTDGGAHFSVQYRGLQSIQSIDALNPSDVFAIGSSLHGTATRKIMSTINGGATWHYISVPGSVHRVDFLTAKIGYAIVGNANIGNTRLLRTEDGGQHWTIVHVPSAALEIGFAGPNNGWMYSYAGVLYHTTNSGMTWTTAIADLPSGFDFAQIRVVNSSNVWFLVAGMGGMSQQSYTVFHSTNGNSFTPVLALSTAGAGPAPGGVKHVPVGPGFDPGPMAAIGSSSAVVFGECPACGMGTVSMEATSDGGAHWTKSHTITGVQGIPTFHSLSFPSATDGWLVDGGFAGPSTLLHTTDGGQTWRPVYVTGHATPTEGISFVDATLGYGLGLPGDSGAVLITANSGHTWTQVGNLPLQLQGRDYGNVSPSPISFPTPTDGFVADSDGQVYHTQNGGKSFAQVDLPQVMGGYDTVYFANKNIGFAMSQFYPNRTEVTTDGGVQWKMFSAINLATAQDALAQQNVAPTLHTLIDAEAGNWVGSFGDIAWILGQNGQSYFQTTDGGREWTNYNFAPSQWPSPATMQFVNAKDGWMLSMNDALLHTTDGGKIWKVIG